MGRGDHSVLGGVAAHLYAEFDGEGLDTARLAAAITSLGRHHPMLRLQVNADGSQQMADLQVAPELEMDDFSRLDAAARSQALADKRQQWTHQQLDLTRGQAARFSLSLLAGGRSRLHIDTDMIAVDPSSFRILLEDLAWCYENPDQALPESPHYFDWLDASQHDASQQSAREAAQQWWQGPLADMAPAPELPLAAEGHAHSTRLHAWLTSDQRQALRKLAAANRLSNAALMLGVFAASLARANGQPRFRLNVPVFWRPPLLAGVERIVGEFANLVMVDVDLRQAPTLATLCDQLYAQLLDRVGRSAYPGVNLMRELSRRQRSAQLAPIVFTAALDMPGGELFSPRVHRLFGELVWVISQGPQVALDAQLANVDGRLLLNWDVRLDALPADWVQAWFDDFTASLRQLAADAAALHIPLPVAIEQPLNALQQAYLLGRTPQLPLGGVAMQEWREYHGHADVLTLRSRLSALVRRHDCLRTVIDPDRLSQRVSTLLRVNLREHDLRHLAAEQATARLAAIRADYAHALSPAGLPPWEVNLFHLPDGSLTLFVRIDALIADGRAIASLLQEWLDDSICLDGMMPAQAASHEPDTQAAASQREQAALYWQNKLGAYAGPPALPWRKPLDQAGVARFARQSLQIDHAAYSRLCKLGSRQRLFKNASIMALLLEVLSGWLEEGSLWVAVPVALPVDGTLANQSSFIPVQWQASDSILAERASRLQADVLAGLQQLAFSGVALGRQLLEQHGKGPVLPVVLTNGLSWPLLPADSPFKLQGGLTQTPQIAMDIRFGAHADGGLQLDIDYVPEVLDDAFVSAYLQAVGKTIIALTSNDTYTFDRRLTHDFDHYRLNSADHAASTDNFLGRLAGRLFDEGNRRIALICGRTQLDYASLGQRVAQTMAGLSARDIRQGQVVAICLPRSIEHSTLTLACALLGIVWVPVDVAAPPERLAYLLDNCRPALVVSLQTLAGLHHQCHPADLLAATVCGQPSADWAALSQSETPAYYLYTSGTTGKPKCVVLNNRATANVLGSTLRHWQVTQNDVFLSVTPLHHDMSVFDVLGSLSAGATLVLPEPGEEKDAVRWNQLINEHRVTLWCSVPAMLEMLLTCSRPDGLASLRLIAQGGDYIKPAIIASLRQQRPQARLISLGGPTETTIWSIWHDITAADHARVPYGHALPGNRYWLLNEQGEHCPVGVTGRIHTTGVNLALGYLLDGQLTQQDFVTVHDEHGQLQRAFRSGDCGRYRADGVLMFESRVNGYVKIRGVRVSLPDIEMELIKHQQLAQVLVVDFGDERQGEQVIGVLYTARDGQQPDIASLREHASQLLPASHVPTRYLLVDSLPLSANGKPDRPRARQWLVLVSQQPAAAGLTSPAAANLALASRPTVMPAQWRQVLDIYLAVLGKPALPAGDEWQAFSQLGLLPRHLKTISAELKQQLDITLSPAQLLGCRDVADVGRLLDELA